MRSLGTYLGLAGGLSFKRFKVKGCQCAFLMHMGTRFTTEAVVSLGTEILFTFLQVSVKHFGLLERGRADERDK